MIPPALCSAALEGGRRREEIAVGCGGACLVGVSPPWRQGWWGWRLNLRGDGGGVAGASPVSYPS